ncbi:MAG: hypothetical protein ACRD0D_07445 [Acidimicrobiales bacterium]
MLVLASAGCLLAGGVVCWLMARAGLLPRLGDDRPGPSWELREGRYEARRLDDLPQGCLFATAIGAGVWILLWLIVLVLALRLVRSPT